MEWKTKTKESPVKFLNESYRLSCRTARHSQKTLKKKCLGKWNVFEILIAKFCSGCYIGDFNFLKLEWNFTLQHCVLLIVDIINLDHLTNTLA